MARIRTIKPEFFTSEDIVALSPLARLLYIALWCEADREGRFVMKAKTIKFKYLPADNCDIEDLFEELAAANLVVSYEADGQQYAVIPTFPKHQHINVREAKSVLPEPTGINVHARAKDSWVVSKELRETVLARDDHRCVRCGATEDLHIDHVFPKSIGGTNAITNLRVLCKTCNCARPVQGQALIDDLKKDGFKMQDMQRMCMHVQDNGEGKGREGKEYSEVGKPTSGVPPSDDDLIWKIGLSILTGSGVNDRNARSILGKHASSDKTKLAGIIGQMAAEKPLEPVAYLEKAMQPKKRGLVL